MEQALTSAATSGIACAGLALRSIASISPASNIDGLVRATALPVAAEYRDPKTQWAAEVVS